MLSWCIGMPRGKEKEDNIYIWISPQSQTLIFCNLLSKGLTTKTEYCKSICWTSSTILFAEKFSSSLRALVLLNLVYPHITPSLPHSSPWHVQRQQPPQCVGGLWLGRHISVPALGRWGDFLDRGVQRCHSNRVARQRRPGVHHRPATGVAQRHQHPDRQSVVLWHPDVCGVSACYRHIHADGPLGAGRGPV